MKRAYSHIFFMVSGGAVLLFPAAVIAQLSNEPFSFRNSPGGLGMSAGGKQAILNQQLFDMRPRNLARDSVGQLLEVQRGPRHTAFLRYPGTETFLTDERPSFREYRPDMAAGVFNNFFSPNLYYSAYPAPVSSEHSGATVSTWTARVSSGGMPISYLGDDNAVDSWTGQVLLLDY